MGINKERYIKIREELTEKHVTLVAVSKMKPVGDIFDMYELGHRDFGENYVQELIDKQEKLPGDIRWHFIGHLQSNKVKYIAAFVHLIHGVDSFKLLKEINRQGKKQNRVIEVLLQVHISEEATKFGMDEKELDEVFKLPATELASLQHVQIRGFMGMASFTDQSAQIKKEFQKLSGLFNKYKTLQIPNVQLEILSMGMSDDYRIAIEEGSNMVRIGSLLFGRRE